MSSAPEYNGNKLGSMSSDPNRGGEFGAGDVVELVNGELGGEWVENVGKPGGGVRE